MGFLDRLVGSRGGGNKDAVPKEEQAATTTAQEAATAPSVPELVHESTGPSYGPPKLDINAVAGSLPPGLSDPLASTSEGGARLYDPYEGEAARESDSSDLGALCTSYAWCCGDAGDARCSLCGLHSGIGAAISRRPQAFKLPTQPEFVFEEEAAVKRRGWNENLQFYTGVGYLSGERGLRVRAGCSCLVQLPYSVKHMLLSLQCLWLVSSCGIEVRCSRVLHAQQVFCASPRSVHASSQVALRACQRAHTITPPPSPTSPSQRSSLKPTACSI